MSQVSGLVPSHRSDQCHGAGPRGLGRARSHQLGGEGQGVRGDTALQMASGAGEGDGVRVSGVIRMSLVMSLDKIRMRKAAIPIVLGIFNLI